MSIRRPANLPANLYCTGLATGLEDRQTLRTGLAPSTQQNFAFCNVVVRRRGGALTKFCVWISRLDLEMDLDNGDTGRLWRAVTARVPFADWAAVEIIQKDYDTNRRRVGRLFTWHARRTPRLINGVNQQEHEGRDMLYELQDHVIDRFEDNTDRTEYTLIIHTRSTHAIHTSSNSSDEHRTSTDAMRRI
jgi:hypothetical protein